MKNKKHRKRKILPVILSVVGILALVALVVVFLFRTRGFEVSGNSYYGETSITTWIEKDGFSVNTLYILAKYNLTDAELPSAVETMKVTLKNPWTVRVIVKEKEMAGYVDYDGALLYFDRSGTAIVRSKKLIEGVPYIEGLEFDAAKVELGEMLPVEDDTVFEKIVEVSRYLQEYELAPDRIVCSDGGIQIYFGTVEVMLGTGNYELRLAQVSPVLQKLQENYPDTAGTLHLENYDESSSSIRFVPSEG